MADAIKTPNVVEATNKPGLYDKLEEIQGRLVMNLFSYFVLMKHFLLFL